MDLGLFEIGIQNTEGRGILLVVLNETEVNWTGMELRAYISYYIYLKHWLQLLIYALTCPNCG